jgi:hypothetical protein
MIWVVLGNNIQNNLNIFQLNYLFIIFQFNNLEAGYKKDQDTLNSECSLLLAGRSIDFYLKVRNKGDKVLIFNFS